MNIGFWNMGGLKFKQDLASELVTLLMVENDLDLLVCAELAAKHLEGRKEIEDSFNLLTVSHEVIDGMGQGRNYAVIYQKTIDIKPLNINGITCLEGPIKNCDDRMRIIPLHLHRDRRSKELAAIYDVVCKEALINNPKDLNNNFLLIGDFNMNPPNTSYDWESNRALIPQSRGFEYWSNSPSRLAGPEAKPVGYNPSYNFYAEFIRDKEGKMLESPNHSYLYKPSKSILKVHEHVENIYDQVIFFEGLREFYVKHSAKLLPKVGKYNFWNEIRGLESEYCDHLPIIVKFRYQQHHENSRTSQD